MGESFRVTRNLWLLLFSKVFENVCQRASTFTYFYHHFTFKNFTVQFTQHSNGNDGRGAQTEEKRHSVDRL